MALAAISNPVPENLNFVETMIAGEAIASRGLAVRKATTGKAVKTNTAAAGTEDVYGFALNISSADGDVISVAKPGAVLTTSGLTPGAPYYVGFGADAGEVSATVADITAPNRLVIGGVALSATRLLVTNIKTGYAVV